MEVLQQRRRRHRVTGGTVWNTPINKRDGQDSWGLLYANFSKKVETGNYGPRFTAGPYGIVSANQDRRRVPSAFSGLMPVCFSDMSSRSTQRSVLSPTGSAARTHYGYFTPGISIALPDNGLFNAGYSIGNDSWEDDTATKNRFVFIYYGVTF